MKSNKLIVIIYLVVTGFSMFICISEGYLGIGSLLTMIFTLPWSVSMIFFAWALIHDGARSLLVFLIPFAGLNAFIIYRVTNMRRARGRKDGDATT